MSEALLKVATGFKLIFYGLMLMFAAIAVMVVAMVAMVFGAAQQAQQGGGGGPQANFLNAAAGLILVVGLMVLVASLMALVGRIMCLAVPEEAGSAKQLIVVSVALEVVGILANIVITADGAGLNFLPIEAKLAVNIGGTIAGVIAIILFLLFAKSLAEFIRRRDLASRAMSVIWLWVGAILCYVGGFGVILAAILGMGGLAGGPNAGGGPGGGAAGGVMAAACGGMLLMLVSALFVILSVVFYALLLTGMASGLQKYARRGQYDDDFDDEDDRPRRGRDRDDDYDDDEDDRPRRGRRDRDDDDDDGRDDRPWNRGR